MNAKAKTVSGAGDYVSVREAAEILRMSSDSVRRFLWKGQLKRYKVGSGRGRASRTLVSRTEVLGLIREV